MSDSPTPARQGWPDGPPYAVASALRGLLPGAGVGLADPAAVHPLWPGEAVAGTPARRREFAAGRAAARRALEAAGLPPAAILSLPDRSPAFPDGLAGSIAHSAALALAAVDPGRKALGIDLEPVVPLAADLWPEVLREDDPEGLDPMARFVLREAAYKAQYPLTRRLFGFRDLRLVRDGDHLSGEVLLPLGLPPIPLRLARAGGHWLAAGWL